MEGKCKSEGYKSVGGTTDVKIDVKIKVDVKIKDFTSTFQKSRARAPRAYTTPVHGGWGFSYSYS